MGSGNYRFKVVFQEAVPLRYVMGKGVTQANLGNGWNYAAVGLGRRNFQTGVERNNSETVSGADAISQLLRFTCLGDR